MAKVFRIFNNSGSNKTDWFNSSQIGGGAIDSITVQETDGKKLPTSIPSPFAQLDLVRNAFKTVSDEARIDVDLDSRKDSHRLVSNALDIGQILFNLEKNLDTISIEVWNKKGDLQKLKDSNSSELKHLGKTLELFLTSSDAKSNNFDKLSDIFILKYNNRVIGGTSPKTLFFASADSVKVGVDIHCGNDKMLDNQPLALYKRDPKYIKALFYLKQQSNFASLFPEFEEYLDLTLSHISSFDVAFANSLSQLNGSNDFLDLTLPTNSGVFVEPLPGVRIQKQIPRDPVNSDFKILTHKNVARPPLVLPIDTYTDRGIYTDEEWKSDTKVPLFDNNPLDARTLPRVKDHYPYLTIGDLLTENIFKLPYKIDEEKYLCIPGYENYLLPLTKVFFDYFTTEDILKNKNFLKFQSIAGDSIEVTLNIPIQKGKSIPYTKRYSKTSSLTLNPHKVGNILDTDFTLGIYPFAKSKFVPVDYAVAVAENETARAMDNFTFYKSEDNTSIVMNERERMKMEGLHSTYYLTESPFDYVVVGTEAIKNILIPKLKEHKNTGLHYEFAIDLGTTNTHIEYKTSNSEQPNPYSLEKSNFGYLRNKKEELRGQAKVNSEVCEKLLNQEVIPNELGNERYSFPFRSVLLENKSINYDRPHYLFSDVNIGFDYGKVDISEHLEEVTDLKWLHLNENFNNEKIKKFIRELLLLCKNKVLMTDGNVGRTKITWLYPTSMTYNQRNLFEDIWKAEYLDVFRVSDLANLRSLPESIAPFYYYTGFTALMNHTQPTATIDVGGGTSDITIFEQNRPKLISSFKFAGNTIFGDGYSNSITHNGFIKQFTSVIKKKLIANQDKTATEIKILEEIYGRGKSIDVSNYFFSLKDNHHLNKENLTIDYFSLLKKDQETKVVFVIFYSALIYHLAQLMKDSGLALPRHILFSGTASKSINLLDSTLTKVSRLFNEIFNEVYNKDDANIEVRIDESPKIITARGALKAEEILEIENLIHTQVGTNGTKFNSSLTYDEIGENVIQEVLENVSNFFSLVDKINTKLDFNKSFGVSSASYEVFKEIRNENIHDYLLQGLHDRKKDVNDTASSLEETLFFYPFIGLLNELAAKVVNQ